MKFLLLSKKGKPRFSNKDPFEYIKSKNKQIIKDYFGIYSDIDITDSIGIHNLKFTNTPYGIIYFNKNDSSRREDEYNCESVNQIATSFYNAYCAVYDGNKKNIYCDCLIIKTTDYITIEEMGEKDITELRRMLKDAIKWFS